MGKNILFFYLDWKKWQFQTAFILVVHRQVRFKHTTIHKKTPATMSGQICFIYLFFLLFFNAKESGI